MQQGGAIMATTITYGNQQYKCETGTSVLECLEANGVAPPSSCRSGICQSCLMQATKGKLPNAAQKGLKPTLAAQNYFLACVCHPEENMKVTLPGEENGIRVPARLVSRTPLNSEIASLILQCASPIEYKPGQFVGVFRGDGLTRSYSLASQPCTDPQHIEIHVRRLPGGQMSHWLHNEAAIGEQVHVTDARGSCYYLPGQIDQPLLLVGTGSGLAPLWGIVRDALNQGHRGPMYLYHGSHSPAGLYLVDALQDLETQHSNFHYIPCVSGAGEAAGFTAGRADDVALEAHPDLSGFRVYLCGRPEMVAHMKQAAFLNGTSMRDIYADPFVLSSRP